MYLEDNGKLVNVLYKKTKKNYNKRENEKILI